MKTKIILITALFSLIFSACNKDILDKKPLDQFSDADFWNDPALVETAVNYNYRFLTPDDGYHDWEAYTNNCINGITYSLCHEFGPKGWTASDANKTQAYTFDGGIHGSDGSNLWGMGYREIRRCNIPISHLEKKENKTDREIQMLAEVKFMRAYQYHLLLRIYGGFVIVTKPLGLGDDLQLPRSNYIECVDFILKDLDEAAAVLPVEWDKANVGRITQGACLSLKGRVQLYSERWEDAANTYQTVMSSGTYSLFPDYRTMFFIENENNEEVILDVQFKYPEWTYLGSSRALSPTQNGGYGIGGPSQNLVDEFELIDGKKWNDPTSAYYDPANPWANREKRFYATVMYDQEVAFGKRVEIGTGYDGKGKLIKGADYRTSEKGTLSGYHLIKGINIEGENIYDGSTRLPINGRNIIILRYAEVLLSYAEARNEAFGPDGSVYDAVNQVRNRAGLPNLAEGLDKDEMRLKIRKERRIELALEWLYYYDCLRWHDLNALENDKNRIVEVDYVYELDASKNVKKDATGRKIIKSRTMRYETYPEPRIFNLDDDFGWFFPLPQREIDRNPNLIQNGQFTGNNKH